MPPRIAKLKNFALVAAVMLPWGCAAGPPAAAPGGPAAPAMAPDYAGAPPMALDRVVVDVAPGTPIGLLKSAKMCAKKEPLAWTQAPEGGATPGFAAAFAEALAGAGYPDGGAEPGLVASAVIERVQAEVCYPLAHYGNRVVRKGEGDVDVAWQVVTRGGHEVVFQGASAGHARLPKGTDSPAPAVVLAAFADAARNLLADPAFATAVRSLPSASAARAP